MTNTDNAPSGDFDAQDAFLDLWEVKDAELSLPDDENTHDEDEVTEDEDAELSDSEETEDDVDNEADEDVEADDDEPEDKPKRKDLSDDDVVTVTIDGEETEVSFRDLKRQYGQHRANDLRSKEIVRERREIEEHSQATRIAAETLYGRAAEKAKVWEKVDWADVLMTAGADGYNALKAEAEKDYADLAFYRDGLEAEVTRHRQRSEQAQAAEYQSRVKAVHEELSNPTTGIEGFSEALVYDLGQYALSMGVPQDRMFDLFHSPILRILHDASRYQKGQKAAKATVPVKKAPTKIVKSSSNSETSRNASKPKNSDAMDQLKRSGSKDDAANAFLAMWAKDE